MAVVCDTGAIYALYDADDAHHLAVRKAIESQAGPFYVPMAILSEIDYLLETYLGVDATLDFLSSLQSGAFLLEPLVPNDLIRCAELMNQYRDLSLGLADGSVAATAERLQIPQLLTVDLRHFRVIRPKPFPYFTLLPADQTVP